MKVKYFSILVLLAIILIGCNNTNYLKLAQNKFSQAKKYNDAQSGIEAIHEILIHSPESVQYKDTLLSLYTNLNTQSASSLALELEKEGNRSLNVLSVLARAYKSAGQAQKALDYYTEINTKVEDVTLLYEKAMLELELSKATECINTSKRIVENKESYKYTVKFDNGKQVEQPVMASAAYFMMGMLTLNEIKDNELALQYLSNAVEIDTTFQLAKNNYATVSYKHNLRKAMGVE